MLFHAIGAAIERKTRAAALSIVAGALLLLGLGFLTSALWMVLVAWQNALFAAQVLGAGFFGLGLIVLVIARIVSRPSRHAEAAPVSAKGQVDPLVQMLEGFLMGLDAGRRTRTSRTRD